MTEAAADPSTPVIPEPMRWIDLPRVTELEQLLFATDSPWTQEMFWAELAQRHHYVVVRDRPDGAVVGYAGLAAVDETEAEVRTIGVHPEQQGRGLGRELLADLLAAAGDSRVMLEVRTDNDPARVLYESVGFRTLGVRRGYYQPSGADAYVMERPPAAVVGRTT